MYSKTINRSYETTGMKGRYTGLSLPDGYSVSYSYDTLGRFSTVTNGSDVYTYAYLTNSNLVSSITYPNTITVTNAYESNRNLIDYVENKHGSTTISKYDYTNDALGRRTAMAKSGTAFTASDTIDYTYNNKSEVTGADAVTDANYDFGFDYDTIGNRKTYDTTESGSNVQSVYSANNLNQYTAITNPSQSPTYNDDGCMLTNGDWTYTWNAENRMVSAVSGTTTVEFKYDYVGRRVEKKVTENSTVTKKEYFVYDNFKLIEKLDALNSSVIVQRFVWKGAKILSINNGTDTYYYTHDANKNVSELLDNSGNIVAHYEYSPFGKVVASSGSYKNDNPIRFSSEYTDQETGLIYYHYRYYIVGLGRWSKKDMIGERGGYNLYGMVSNQVINKWDYLGLDVWDITFDYTTVGGTEHAETGINNQGMVFGSPTYDMQEECDDTCPYPECTRYKLSCSLKVSIEGEVYVKMPILHNQDELSEKAMKAWNCWIAAIKEHEDRHVKDYEDFLSETTTVNGYVESCSSEGLEDDCASIMSILAKTWYDNLVIGLEIQSGLQHALHGYPPPTPYHCLDKE
jgi:RHS repeat-associated protein